MVLSLWPAKEWTLLLSFIRWHDEHGGLLLNSRSNQEFIQNMVIEKIVRPFPMSFLESSGCVRYGVLSLEAGRCFGKDDIQVANYMQQFFNHMRMAIEVPELTDIIIGSFTLFLSASYQDNMHLQGIHYRGLTAAFAELIRGAPGVSDAETILAFKLYITALQYYEISYWGEARRAVLSYRGRSKQGRDVYVRRHFRDTMNCLLGIEGFGPLRNEMCATEPHRSHLMFCLDNYLAMKIGAGASSRDCSSELQNMVQRIISVPLKASVESDFRSISKKMIARDSLTSRKNA